MVDNVGGNGAQSGKIWTKIKAATTDSTYKKGLDAKVNSIMQGNKTVDVDKLKNDPVYANMNKKALARFNEIANLDGDAKSFSKDELRLLYALSDAKLVDGKFEFDLKWDNTEQSALAEATSKPIKGELQVFVENLTSDKSSARHIKEVDTSKFDKSKPLSDKLKSDNPDEVMVAINDEIMTDYVNPKTGKKMPITEITSIVSRYTEKHPNMDESDICKNLQKEYGIPISNYERLRGGDCYKVGDWNVESSDGIFSGKNISNSKTGVSLEGYDKDWHSYNTETIPNTNGFVFMIDTFSDKKGNKIEFTTQNEVNTIQPSGATVYAPDGSVKEVKYDIEETVDPSIYNFVYEK